MVNKQRRFNALLIAAALAIISVVTIFYLIQLKGVISENIISSIDEIAEHDKAAIQSYIDICWNDLYEIQKRFISYDCKTIEDVEIKMNLECASSDFTHIYMLAEDGTIYSDKFVTYTPGNDVLNRSLDFLPYFEDGSERVILRFDDKNTGGWLTKESILYGVRLNGYEVDGVKMLALIGISDISSIQENMVINSFVKDGNSRGNSFLIDGEGYYVINTNRGVYLNRRVNLYDHLSESIDSEMTNEDVAQKLKNRETFSFYHTHAEDGSKELLYFTPFTNDTDMYFVISVNNEVFDEQTKTFVIMSMAMLVASMTAVVSMLLFMMRNRYMTILATEKAKSQKEFLSNMSHEIRTPLNGLIGMNHLIMVHIDDESQRPQIKEWLKKSHSTANYLLSLVNDILDLSKLQAGKVSLLNEPLLLTALVDEIVAMQADNIKSRGVEFILETDITEPCIEGDAIRIKQILMNIVGNAAKFTPKGKYIKLSVSQQKTDDTHVSTSFRCEDTGIGISPEYIDKIFDSFSQDRTRNTNGIKGTGLGMAISKLLVNAMGGSITVESELDVGSTFTVTIPSLIIKEIPGYLKEAGQDDIVSQSAPLRNKADGKPLKVLVAEDMELNAEILLEILALEGFEAVHANNGKEALELFQNSGIGEFDIILMDMQMPVMDGCTAASEIRKLPRADAGSVRIYACTANTFQEDRDMALEHGMDDFLTKPIDINALLKKLGSSE